MIQRLIVDDLTFGVRWSNRRKTVELTVDRGGELLIHAPVGTDKDALERLVRDKQSWVYAKRAEKAALGQVVAKEFATGEGFSYLGRSYRLLLVDEQDVPLKFEHGRLKLLRSEAVRGREHFVRWYSQQAYQWLSVRINDLAARVGVDLTAIKVMDLGFRWGSRGKNGNLNFHWAVILMPPSIIEYVAVHELVHLSAPSHGPEFWQRVERVIPDFDSRRRWLAENGSSFALVPKPPARKSLAGIGSQTGEFSNVSEV